MNVAEAGLSFASRIKYHHPKYSAELPSIKPEPYLTLPLRKGDLSHWQIRSSQIGIGRKIDYQISEGWWYSKETRRLFPYRHAAIDFLLPFGFPVAAPCDGYAMSSYYSYPEIDENGNQKTKGGKPLNFGIGYFVQIYNLEQKRFIQLGHLSDIAKNIPFSPPEKRDGRFQPTNHVQTPEQLMTINNPSVVFVKTGDTVGFVGYSGLTYGEDYKEGYDRPHKIDPKVTGSHDLPHLHMDEFFRNYQTGQKSWRRDPYDLYALNHSYPTHQNNLNIGKEPLFLTNKFDRPLFADS